MHTQLVRGSILQPHGQPSSGNRDLKLCPKYSSTSLLRDISDETDVQAPQVLAACRCDHMNGLIWAAT